ncbi:uncharacterized protein LOC112969212 [Apteryx rowi]|uniref:uncharacterized protein LOC112969212 n=1 Tax=Apteryx rowi TaxID=308060 RepID=UPI000E1D46C2|nr:uncharacterized protein LOC112969212 [Apteryx rowi]
MVLQSAHAHLPSACPIDMSAPTQCEWSGTSRNLSVLMSLGWNKAFENQKCLLRETLLLKPSGMVTSGETLLSLIFKCFASMISAATDCTDAFLDSSALHKKTVPFVAANSSFPAWSPQGLSTSHELGRIHGNELVRRGEAKAAEVLLQITPFSALMCTESPQNAYWQKTPGPRRPHEQSGIRDNERCVSQQDFHREASTCVQENQSIILMLTALLLWTRKRTET